MYDQGFELDELQMELMALDGRRYHCSQILVSLGLRLQARENPELVRAAGGLAFGLGHSNETCGALLGGCCLLGLYGGKGHDDKEKTEWYGGQQRHRRRGLRRGSEARGQAPENAFPPVPSPFAPPPTLLEGVYTALRHWMEENGYEPVAGSDGARNVYLNSPHEVPPEELRTEVQ